MAASGFGKRSAPDQAPRTRDDFAHLPAREAAIAAHIDRLPDGAAVDIKTLAEEIPAYGQQAVQTALNNLSDADHLPRIRETGGEGRTQWVTRSYFSRTARLCLVGGRCLCPGTSLLSFRRLRGPRPPRSCRAPARPLRRRVLCP